MKFDLYTAAGVKKGSIEGSDTLFAARINPGLMHQFLILQQHNRRRSPAHVKTRGEIRGSTRKVYQQKGTGRARRGSIRSPILRGGSKAFGPRKEQNSPVRMPQKMRHAAIRSCLSARAKGGVIFALADLKEGKTSTMRSLLENLPVELGRKILFVLPEKQKELTRATGNIPRVSTVLASYLNPEDVLSAHHIIFVSDAMKKAEEIFAKPKPQLQSKR